MEKIIMIIQAMPSSGKTTLTSNRLGKERKFIDMDDLIVDLVGGKDKSAYDKVMSTPACREILNAIIMHIQQVSNVLLTPYDVEEELGWPIDFAVAYLPDDYIEHVVLSERFDLLNKIGESKLRSWADDYVRRSKTRSTVFLDSHQFLPDAITLWNERAQQNCNLKKVES
jgi:hypothetical protein